MEAKGVTGGSIWFKGRSNKCSSYIILYSRVSVVTGVLIAIIPSEVKLIECTGADILHHDQQQCFGIDFALMAVWLCLCLQHPLLTRYCLWWFTYLKLIILSVTFNCFIIPVIWLSESLLNYSACICCWYPKSRVLWWEDICLIETILKPYAYDYFLIDYSASGIPLFPLHRPTNMCFQMPWKQTCFCASRDRFISDYVMAVWLSLQIRVCAFPASALGLQGIGISPDCNPENRASRREVLILALSLSDLFSVKIGRWSFLACNYCSFLIGHWSLQRIKFLINSLSLDI